MDKNIFVLTIDNEDQCYDMYFSSLEKATEYIKIKFSYDNIRKVTKEYYEGKRNTYSIKEWCVDQDPNF